jgi:ElaB/YqjD/DUF883 family membrane-anchored ribosome-binding protein
MPYKDVGLRTLTEPTTLGLRCWASISKKEKVMEKDATTGKILDTYELAERIDALRADVQNLSSVVGRIAEKELEQNPVSALAIAVGLGFLFAIFIRRL